MRKHQSKTAAPLRNNPEILTSSAERQDLMVLATRLSEDKEPTEALTKSPRKAEDTLLKTEPLRIARLEINPLEEERVASEE